jgi:hypothetical protein
MKKSEVVYLDNLHQLLNITFSEDSDYIIKSSFPLNYETIKNLVDLEIKNAEKQNDIFNLIYLEFETLDLSSRQIINLCNNLNVNLLIKNLTIEQTKDLLMSYYESNVNKTIYPIKIIVLLSLVFLYLKIIKDQDHFDDFEEFAKFILDDMIYFTYISDKYKEDYIIEMSKWFIMYLINEKPEFISYFKQICNYLLGTVVEYCPTIKASKYFSSKDSQVSNFQLQSGIYIPLAYIMKYMLYNPFSKETFFNNNIKFDFIPKQAINQLLKPLSNLSLYATKSLEYIENEKTGKFNKDKLQDLNNDEILDCLFNKKIITTKDPVTKVDLFPLEIEVIT